ncbi:MAG: fimbrillin family protein, partial [Prevotella sp.]
VNSKGTYSIPLVYGCAIKNGSDNTLSYNKSTYVNHAETQISSPYIYSMVNNVDGAKLVWQDVQNMVAVNSSLGDNGHSLIFTIGDNIAQGNAVVAATAGGTVVWSWHIWVTDRDVSVNAAIPTKALDTSKTYYFMPVPLGWCDGTTSTVAPRNVTLSLTQGQSGKNLSASIAQAGSTATSGNFTYYQWGRKDPFVGSTGSGNTTKTWYDGNGTTNNTNPTTTSQTSKAESIKYPEKFISGSSTWDTSTTYDNWNAILESTTAPNTPYNYDAVEKTVYDPSPVGYKLPATMAFSGFTIDGKNKGSTEMSSWNVKSTTMTNNGYEFYTQGWKTEPTDFWIAGGYRHYNNSGSLYDVGSRGYYWSAGPRSNTYGCSLTFHSSSVGPQNGSYRAYGFSVRPVSE